MVQRVLQLLATDHQALISSHRQGPLAPLYGLLSWSSQAGVKHFLRLIQAELHLLLRIRSSEAPDGKDLTPQYALVVHTLDFTHPLLLAPSRRLHSPLSPPAHEPFPSQVLEVRGPAAGRPVALGEAGVCAGRVDARQGGPLLPGASHPCSPPPRPGCRPAPVWQARASSHAGGFDSRRPGAAGSEAAL